MAVLSPNEIAYLAQSVGFSGGSRHNTQRDDVIAVAIALCESGGDTNANPQNRGVDEDSRGLWQIHVPTWGDRLPDSVVNQLYEPGTNARVAFMIYQFAGRNFSDWSCYNNGGYARHLRAARRGVADPEKPEKVTGVVGFGEPALNRPANLLAQLGNVLEAFQFVTDPDNWRRVAMFTGGVLLGIAALVLWLADADVASRLLPPGKLVRKLR